MVGRFMGRKDAIPTSNRSKLKASRAAVRNHRGCILCCILVGRKSDDLACSGLLW